jgi:hypothetical protein
MTFSLPVRAVVALGAGVDETRETRLIFDMANSFHYGAEVPKVCHFLTHTFSVK